MKIKKKIASIISLALAAIFVTLSLTGCSSTRVVAQGWAGIGGIGDRLFYIFTQPSAGGFLGCGASTSKSQLVILSAVDGGKINTIDLPDSTISYGTPTLSGNYAYLTGYNGKVYRVDTVSGGTPLAVYLNPDKPQSIVGAALVADGRVFVASADGNIYALDATSLNSQWTFSTGDKIWSTPSAENGIVYIGSFDKNVYALDAASGAKKWIFATGGAIVATPIVADGRVYIASLDRHIYALDANSGNLIWQFPSDSSSTQPQNWFWATPLLINNQIFAPNMDGNVYILNAQDGAVVSEPVSFGSSIASSPVIVGNKIFLSTETGKLYSLDTTTKAPYLIKDLTTEIRSPLFVLNDLVYIHSIDKIYQYDFESNDSPKEIGTNNSTVTSTSTVSIIPSISTTVVTVTVTTTK
jgi:eukaryotic-like serine/threonine-protein kinase